MVYQCCGLVLNQADSLEIQQCVELNSNSTRGGVNTLISWHTEGGRGRQTSARACDDGLISRFSIVIKKMACSRWVQKRKLFFYFFCDMISQYASTL